jgi:hypothetical protein
MTLARILCRVGYYGVVAVILVGCAKPAVVDDRLAAAGAPAEDFSIDDQTVTLSARFNTGLAANEPFMVEWLFPDGKIYLRKPVRRSYERPDLIETSMPIRDKGPARYPGIWQVRLWRDGDKLVDRSFEIRKPTETATSAGAGFAALAYCGPSRWNDPVISARRSAPLATRVPGAWIGGDLLEAAGATYSSVVLLTGCAPG